MSITERRVYTRFTIHCDWCHREESVVRLDDEDIDSRHQLPPIHGWRRVPVENFLTNREYHACSQDHAERIAIREIREVA